MLTFDLYPDLTFISSCDVADDTQVSPLVLYLDISDLQGPVAVGLKAISLQIPLSIFRPVVWTDP